MKLGQGIGRRVAPTFPAHRSACPGRPPAPARCARRPGAPAASPDRRAIPPDHVAGFHEHAPAGRKPVASPWSPGCPRASPRCRARRRAAPALAQRRGALGARRTAGCRRPGRRPLRGLFDAGAIQQRRRGIAAGEGNHARTAPGRNSSRMGEPAGRRRRRRRESGSWSARGARGADVQAGRGGVFGAGPAGRGRAPAIRPGRLRTARSRRARAAQVAFERAARFVGRVVALLCAARFERKMPAALTGRKSS